MERRQARTMRIYSERVWKKVFLTVSIPVTLCVLLYLIGNRLGILEGHTDLAFDACRYDIYA